MASAVTTVMELEAIAITPKNGAPPATLATRHAATATNTTNSVARPTRAYARGPADAAGAGGVLLLVDSHFASDIIAGYLLASMWFVLAAAMVAAPAASAGPRAYARVGLATLFVVLSLIHI